MLQVTGGPLWALPTDLPQQLGHNLDLLATGEQIAERYTSDTCHLHGVHQHHEPLQQPQRQVGVFEAVHCQAAAGLVIPVLGAGTNGVRRAWKGRGFDQWKEVKELTVSERGGSSRKGWCG